MASPHAGSWPKSPPELIARFRDRMAMVPGISVRQMFGYPAAFASNGHMYTGLHQDRWVIRLPDDARAELAAAGGTPCEVMPGRAMRDYLVLPQAILDDADELSSWLDRSLAYTEGLPAKSKR
jgi:TfoX/Sxy family transcriptional regulator of competence genes